MDYGPYNNDGNTPPSYSAYERFYMGWITPRVLNEPENVEDARRDYFKAQAEKLTSELLSDADADGNVISAVPDNIEKKLLHGEPDALNVAAFRVQPVQIILYIGGNVIDSGGFLQRILFIGHFSCPPSPQIPSFCQVLESPICPEEWAANIVCGQYYFVIKPRTFQQFFAG